MRYTIVTYVLILLLTFLFVACKELPVDAITVDGIEFSLILKEYNVEKVEDFRADFIVRNASSEVKRLGFSSGCHFGYTIAGKNQDLVLAFSPHGCIAILTSLEIEPNETKVFEISPTASGEFVNGTYIISAFLLDNNSPVITKEFEVSTR